jgi:hypothetical protein
MIVTLAKSQIANPKEEEEEEEEEEALISSLIQ